MKRHVMSCRTAIYSLWFIALHLTWWRMCMFCGGKEMERMIIDDDRKCNKKYLNTWDEEGVAWYMFKVWHGYCRLQQKKVSEMLLIEISSNVFFLFCVLPSSLMSFFFSLLLALAWFRERAKTNKTSKLIKQIIFKVTEIEMKFHTWNRLSNPFLSH